MSKRQRARDKIVRQMSRSGAVEVNKSTGAETSISARDESRTQEVSTSPPVESVQNHETEAKKQTHKKANAEIFKRNQPKAEVSQLKFLDETTKNSKLKTGRVLDLSKMRLSFMEGEKSPNGKLQHILDAPRRESALVVHREIDKSDNTGVEATHSVEKASERGARVFTVGYKRLRFHRQHSERKNTISPNKVMQKKRIKREYAKAFRQRSKDTSHAVATAAKRTTHNIGRAVVRVVKSVGNIKLFATFGMIFLVLMLLMAGVSSCAAMFSGGLNAILATSYTSEDEDMLGAHEDYTELERELSERLANISDEFPDYDEYRFELDHIGHDPHELISYLTALLHFFTREQVQDELLRIFEQQYTLTFISEVEIRTRTETHTDSEGETYTVEVEYSWYILTVRLENRGIRAVAEENLTPEQFEMFLIYLETQGNRPDLFAELVEPSIVPTNERFAAMMEIAEQFIGFPYVWGGSNPATSFDCSGFVSWVINQSGVGSVGRMTANGLYNHTISISAYEARPGDLIFFQGTWNVRGASHVGLYTGGGVMLHAGDPIGFASIRTPYWVNHFKGFGRLP